MFINDLIINHLIINNRLMLVYCHNSTLISEADLGTESAIPDQCLTNV